MTDRLLLVDFDRTLFDTSRFAEVWWRWAAGAYQLDTAHQLGQIEEYLNYVGQWRSYDFYQHIKDLQLGELPEATLERARRELKDYIFVYDDAKAVFELKKHREVEVVTFGNEFYQSYKMTFVPQLDGWTKHITGQEKGDYIKEQFGEQKLVLVDDKDLAGSLPATVRFIRLDRSQAEPVRDNAACRSINSLEQLGGVL